METTYPYYVTKIKDCLSQRQRENPHYSLRAFARDIGVHQGTLGQVLKGQRPLPLKVTDVVINKLKLGPKERTLFMESLLRRKTSIDDIAIDDLDQRFMLDESYYKILAEWEHAAVLELFNVLSFEGSINEISDRLAIPINRAEIVLQNLLVCGLIVKTSEGSLALAYPDLRTTEDVTSQALRESHIETMKIGSTKIEEIAVELRDYSSTTVAIDLDQLQEAKTIIREFRQKMSALLRDGQNKTDVYQLAIQFFPLTNVQKQH